MKIGILGSGLMGSKLGKLWASAGHEVMFSYSRNEQKLRSLAENTENATWGTVAGTAADCNVLLLAVHWSRIDDVLEQAGSLAGKIILNCCVPLDTQNRDLVVGTTTSGAEELAKRCPAAHWVSTFNTTPSEAFDSVFYAKDKSPRPDVLYYGDDKIAKRIAVELIRDIGFEPRNAGPLRTARFCEPFAMITAELAYAQPGGPKLVYRFDKLH